MFITGSQSFAAILTLLVLGFYFLENLKTVLIFISSIAFFTIMILIFKKRNKDFKIDDAILEANKEFGTNFKFVYKLPNILFDEEKQKILILDKDYFVCKNIDFVIQWESDDNTYVKVIIDDSSHPYIVIYGNKKEIEIITAQLALFTTRWKRKVFVNP